MARKTAGVILAIARDIARHQRQAEAARNRQKREAERQARAADRERKAAHRRAALDEKQRAREEKARYIATREQQVHDLNNDIHDRLSSFNQLLPHTLSVDDSIPFDSLRINDAPQDFVIPESLRPIENGPTETPFTATVEKPKGLWQFIPSAKRRYEESLQAAKQSYQHAVTAWKRENARRSMKLMEHRQRHNALVEAYEKKRIQRDAEVATFKASYEAGDSDAIVAYCSMVLERSSYPDGFPQTFSIAYTISSKQLVVQYELPTVTIVPDVIEYRYVKSSDKIASKSRRATDTKDIYQDIISSVALRTIHELFEADQGNHFSAICFNGFIQAVDPATGKDIQPHLVSVRTTRERFCNVDLSRVDKRVCLKNLGAQVSRRPDEAQPVRPIVEFSMTDSRFVDQTDLVSGLSSACNLMELNPYEFEQLVANLFGQLGLESKLTRSSRDGGVDCVAYDERPILGGKVVIQAKRYRNTVGVAAVRDLFGTMMNEGANKGILVTTSGYGPDAFDFAKDKPIELIDGSGLLFLLQEIGTEARIVFPEDT